MNSHKRIFRRLFIMNDWLPVSRRTISHTYTHRDTHAYTCTKMKVVFVTWTESRTTQHLPDTKVKIKNLCTTVLTTHPTSERISWHGTPNSVISYVICTILHTLSNVSTFRPINNQVSKEQQLHKIEDSKVRNSSWYTFTEISVMGATVR